MILYKCPIWNTNFVEMSKIRIGTSKCNNAEWIWKKILYQILKCELESYNLFWYLKSRLCVAVYWLACFDHEIMTEGITSLFFSEKFIYLMVPIDFINDQDIMRRVIWRYIYTLKIQTHIKDSTWYVIIFTVIQ